MADTQVHEIVIHASPDNVWDALTNGDVTKRYFFGETIVSDWNRARRGIPSGRAARKTSTVW